MKHAIHILKTAHETAANNGPIAEAEGKLEQAALDRRVKSDIEEALAILDAHLKPRRNQSPSVGRIVIFTGQGFEFPAVITQVWSEECVNLRVFRDDDVPEEIFTSVTHSTEKETHTWHWPARG